MKNISEKWIQEKLEYIENITENYSPQEKDNIQYEYLKKLMIRIPKLENTNENELIEKINLVTDNLPKKTNGITLNYGNSSNNIENLKTYTKNKYKLVSRGHYKRILFSYGIVFGPSFGLPFGVAITNIGLGMLVGMCLSSLIGIIFGIYLDKKARVKNRVL